MQTTAKKGPKNHLEQVEEIAKVVKVTPAKQGASLRVALSVLIYEGFALMYATEDLRGAIVRAGLGPDVFWKYRYAGEALQKNDPDQYRTILRAALRGDPIEVTGLQVSNIRRSSSPAVTGVAGAARLRGRVEYLTTSLEGLKKSKWKDVPRESREGLLGALKELQDILYEVSEQGQRVRG